ncbi:MAG: c-type cytochrome [Thermoanaerobaculia bacterium]
MKRLMFAAALLFVACNRQETAQSVQKAAPAATENAGNTARGRELVSQYGCNVCHAIPGIEGPAGILGPALSGLMSRPAITQAQVPNTPQNLLQFIQNPQSLNPQSSMPPPQGMTPDDAKDIVAFLQTLK